jgi:hypothetical protein
MKPHKIVEDERSGPVGKAELEAMGCETPGCTHDHSVIYMASHCHPGGGLFVKFVKDVGALIMECKVCRQPVGGVWVGEAPESAPDGRLHS